ncbi:hypothetical protein OSC12_08085 [Citrobacter portucalensis]|nr:hypothetical protein [Citrobacter portucalensis]
MTTFFKLMLAYHREKAFHEGRYLSSSSLPWPERYRRKPLMRWSPRDRTLFKIADRDLNYKKLGKYSRPEVEMVIPIFGRRVLINKLKIDEKEI